MEIQIFLVLFLFMGLFLGGGALLVLGALRKKKKVFLWGLVLFLASVLLVALTRNMGSLY